MCCVGEMVGKLRVRPEVTSSNPPRTRIFRVKNRVTCDLDLYPYQPGP
jgi:hypothetical protein